MRPWVWGSTFIFYCFLSSGTAYGAKCPALLETRIGTSRPVSRFADHPPRQPKITIGRYGGRNGVQTPHFFTLAEALRRLGTGVPIIFRSEHPAELLGHAGVFKSFVFTESKVRRALERIDTDNLTLMGASGARAFEGYLDVYAALARLIAGRDNEAQFFENLRQAAFGQSARRYVEYMGLDAREFLSSLTFSIWEYIPGVNHTIVADSAVTGRYHVFSNYTDNQSPRTNYALIENGRVTESTPAKNPPFKIDAVQMVRLYERIRNLPRFDPSNCPAVEIQQGLNDELWFLQYHVGRQQELATFERTRKLEAGEVEADFVRGATTPTGSDYTVSYWSMANVYENALTLPSSEDGGVDAHDDGVLAEIMSTRRRLQLHDGTLADAARLRFQHGRVSMMTNAPITVYLNLDLLFGGQTPPDTFRVRVTSDGKRAYVKLIP